MNATMDSLPAKLKAAELMPFDDSTDLLGDPGELRARAEHDGYLFFRGLLDPEPILQLRSEVLDVLARHGLRAPDADHPLDGKLDLVRLNELPADQMRVDIGVSAGVYIDLQRLPSCTGCRTTRPCWVSIGSCSTLTMCSSIRVTSCVQ